VRFWKKLFARSAIGMNEIDICASRDIRESNVWRTRRRQQEIALGFVGWS
jgi:hypothetical protein